MAVELQLSAMLSNPQPQQVELRPGEMLLILAPAADDVALAIGSVDLPPVFRLAISYQASSRTVSTLFEKGWQKAGRVGAVPVIFGQSAQLSSVSRRGAYVVFAFKVDLTRGETVGIYHRQGQDWQRIAEATLAGATPPPPPPPVEPTPPASSSNDPSGGVSSNGPPTNAVTPFPTGQDYTALLHRTNLADIDVLWSCYDVASDPETNATGGELEFRRTGGTLTEGSRELVHDGNHFRMSYAYTWTDEWKQETSGRVLLEGEFSDTKESIEYLKAYQTVTYPDSSGWWTDEWEIVITDTMHFRSPKGVEIVDTQQVIDYVLIGGADKHYTAWNRIRIKDNNGVPGEYTLNETKGGARYIEAQVRFYLPWE